jgi:hypothetical protein
VLHGGWQNGPVRRRQFDDVLGRFDEVLARIDRNSEETRLYIRESGLRFERFMQAMDRRIEDLEAEARRSRETTDAHTKAIWALLDRWGYGPGNPPPEPA